MTIPQLPCCDFALRQDLTTLVQNTVVTRIDRRHPPRFVKLCREKLLTCFTTALVLSASITWESTASRLGDRPLTSFITHHPEPSRAVRYKS